MMIQKIGAILKQVLPRSPYFLVIITIFFTFATVGSGGCQGEETFTTYSSLELIKKDIPIKSIKDIFPLKDGKTILLSIISGCILLIISFQKKMTSLTPRAGFLHCLLTTLAAYNVFLVMMISVKIFASFKPHEGFFLQLIGWSLIYGYSVYRMIMISRSSPTMKQYILSPGMKKAPLVIADFILSCSYILFMTILFVDLAKDLFSDGIFAVSLGFIGIVFFFFPMIFTTPFIRQIHGTDKKSAILWIAGKGLLLILFITAITAEILYGPVIALLLCVVVL